jgi:uncharacterized protein YodC (DUF2158 family)
MSAPFKVGDLVRLKNPWGPVMTVSEVAPAGVEWSSIQCVWFDTASRVRHSTFAIEILELWVQPE